MPCLLHLIIFSNNNNSNNNSNNSCPPQKSLEKSGRHFSFGWPENKKKKPIPSPRSQVAEWWSFSQRLQNTRQFSGHRSHPPKMDNFSLPSPLVVKYLIVCSFKIEKNKRLMWLSCSQCIFNSMTIHYHKQTLLSSTTWSFTPLLITIEDWRGLKIKCDYLFVFVQQKLSFYILVSYLYCYYY